MNPTFRIHKRPCLQLLVMHILLIALLAFVMAASMPVGSLNG